MGEKIRTTLGILLASWVGLVWAQEVRVTASVDRQELAVGERLTLQIVVEGSQSASTPEFKELRGLRVVQGPATSTQVSIINGAMSSSVTFTYELMATAEGEQEIGPIEVRVGRQVYRTTPMKIVVTRTRGVGVANEQAGKAVFLVLQADRTNVYVNEQIVLTATLYFRDVQVANVSQPQVMLQGFEVYEQGYHQGDAVINNLRYRYVRFPLIVFPLQVGRMEVGPVRMKVSVREPVAPRARGFFDDGFFGGGLLDEFFGRFQVVEHEIESNTVTVEVKKVPEEGRPEGYTGAVGEYELEARVEPREVQAGSAVTLTVELRGSGNINSVSMAMLTNTAELRVYEPETRREQRVEGMRMVGKREYTQLVVPVSERVKEIPAVRFVYFNPREGRFVELVRGPFEVRVTPAAEGSEVRMADYRPRGEGARRVKVLAEDILGIKTRVPVAGLRRVITEPGVAGLIVGGPLVWAGAVVLAWWRERLKTDRALTRRLQAGGRLRRRLREARGAYRRREYRRMCEALAEGLCGYIADQLHVSAAQVETGSVEGLLAERGVGAESIARVKRLLERCDFGRFGGVMLTPGEAGELLDEGERVAARLERELR